MKYRVPVLETFCWQEPVLNKHGDPENLPITASKGHRYLVQNGIGDWLGKNDLVAWYDGTTWKFDTPEEGWQLYIVGEIEGERQKLYTVANGWVSASATSADKLKLGSPSDGGFTDGLLDFVEDNLVVDTIDDINEILKDIAPPDAVTLQGKTLTHNATTKTGKLPTGLPAAYYENGSGGTLSAGTTLTNIIASNSLTISSPSPSDTFNKGDEGLLKVKQAIGNNTYNVVATLDIVANYVKVIDTTQTTFPNWDNQGSGDPCTNGIVNLTNSRGSLQVTSIGWYNDFNKWQKMNCQINVTNLDGGFNSWKLLHDLTTDQESNALTLYYGNENTALSFSATPDLVFNSYGSNTKYVSGVRYYTTGDNFTISYTGANVYKNYYHPTSVSTWTWAAYNASAQTLNPGDTGVAETSPPAYDGNITVSKAVAVAASNYRSEDSIFSASLLHPWKTTASASSPSHGFMISTYGNFATELLDSFEDENYRLPAGDYDTIPGAISGLWDSTGLLSNGQALQYAGNLQYPTVNLTAKSPAGPNYSTGFSGNQVYYRAFRKSGSAASSVALSLTGLVGANVGIVGSGNINVEVKLPTQTGWLDAAKPFDAGTFGNGPDGTGCLATQSGIIWSLTFGGKSTANSGYMIIVRITFRTANSSIQQAQVNW